MRSAERHRPYTPGYGRSGARSHRDLPDDDRTNDDYTNDDCPNYDCSKDNSRTFRPAGSPNDSAPVTGSRS